MTPKERDEGEPTMMDVRHLRREARTALELAVVGLAPSSITDRLALAAGLFEALAEFPSDSPPVAATLRRAMTTARAALEDWTAWRSQHPES